MITAGKASEFAEEWIEAWNNHDLNRIVAHYSDDIIFSLRFVASVGGVATSSLCGREALGVYFKAALNKFPSLRFELRTVFHGTDALTIIYESVNDRCYRNVGIGFRGAENIRELGIVRPAGLIPIL